MKNVLILDTQAGSVAHWQITIPRQGAQVTGISRTTHGLDYLNPASIDAVMTQIDGPFDRVIVASGALEIDSYAPEKTIQAVTAQGMADQFAVNAIGPVDFETHQTIVSATCARGGCGFVGACWVHRG